MQCSPLDIRCPGCSDLAQFDEPFDFVGHHQQVEVGENRPCHQWGGWTVIERFPSVLLWQPPSGSHQFLRSGGDNGQPSYPLLTRGVIRCTVCHLQKVHNLSWPQDTYRNKLLAFVAVV